MLLVESEARADGSGARSANPDLWSGNRILVGNARGLSTLTIHGIAGRICQERDRECPLDMNGLQTMSD
jgi:hypothetical protein